MSMSADLNFGSSDAEATRTALIAFLRSSFGQLQLGNVQQFVRVAEESLLYFLRVHVQVYLFELANGELYSASDGELAASDGERYIVAVSEEPLRHCDLYLTCLSITASVTPASLREIVIDLNQPGRFRTLSVVVPSAMSAMGDALAQRGKFLLDAGSAWMADRVIGLVDRDQIRIAEGLYVLSREIFPEDAIREQVWFATVGPIYGFRLITPEVARAALKTMAATTLELPVDPVDLLAELLATRLPRELLLMDKAARVDQNIEMDIADAGYSRGISRYPFVLKSLYGGSSLTMMPLLRADRFAVLALYPAGNVTVRDRLSAHRAEFEARARELSEHIIKASSLFEIVDDEAAPHRIRRTRNVAHLLGESLDEVVAEHDDPTRRWKHLRFGRSQ